jgi:hypothetical protein
MSVVDAGIVTQWVCCDCYVLLCNGDMADGVEGLEALLSKFEGFIAVPGLREEEHSENCPRDEDGECDCEDDTYSTKACDGCGDACHGERHAVTLLQDQPDEGPQHADYPHTPGTLYDCLACDMPA